MTMSKPKILIAACTPFTINSFMVHHLNNLSKNFRVYLIVNEKLDELSKNISKNVTIQNINFSRKISILSDIRCMITIYFYLKKEKINIVLSLTSKIGLLVMMMSFLARVKFRLHIFTGFIWYNKKNFKKLFFKLIDIIICRFCTNILVDSKGQIKLLINEKITHKNINLLGNGSICGIDPKKFFPCKTSYVDERRKDRKNLFIFLFVGRLTKEKGIIELVSMFKKINKLKKNIELWIVGPDEENIIKNLKEKDLNSNIKYFGKSSDVSKYMVRSDLLVLPSSREGFGNVIIEAGSCGLPCIAYDINGPNEIIINNKTGFIIKNKNQNEFYKKMLDVCKNKHILSQLRKNVRKRTISLYNKDDIEKVWLHFFNDLANRV